MPDKFNELLLKQDIIELYNAGITPDYGYLMNGRFEKDMVKTLYPLKTLSGNPITWEASDTEYLFPVVSLEPKQAGTGDPSPDNVRPISGYDSVTVTQSKDEAQVKQITLALPETIYGGTVDAVTGVGESQIAFMVLDGTENWVLTGATSDTYQGFSMRLPYTNVNYRMFCSHFMYKLYENVANTCSQQSRGEFNVRFVISTEIVPNKTVDEWKSYLAAQAAAGTPVQVAYKLTTPTPFQATGNQALTIQPGNHTMYTDGNNISLSRKARRLEV